MNTRRVHQKEPHFAPSLLLFVVSEGLVEEGVGHPDLVPDTVYAVYRQVNLGSLFGQNGLHFLSYHQLQVNWNREPPQKASRAVLY